MSAQAAIQHAFHAACAVFFPFRHLAASIFSAAGYTDFIAADIERSGDTTTRNVLAAPVQHWLPVAARFALPTTQ
jgi:hypothetical protein